MAARDKKVCPDTLDAARDNNCPLSGGGVAKVHIRIRDPNGAGLAATSVIGPSKEAAKSSVRVRLHLDLVQALRSMCILKGFRISAQGFRTLGHLVLPSDPTLKDSINQKLHRF